MKLLCSTLSSLALAMTATMILTASAQTAFSNEAFDSPARDIESEVADERLKENWSDADVFGLRAFAEPLVADLKAPSKGERAAFSQAINDYLVDRQHVSLEGSNGGKLLEVVLRLLAVLPW